MLDLRFIRENPDLVKEALVKLNTTAPIDEILSLDEQRRELLSEVEALRARRNAVSKRISWLTLEDMLWAFLLTPAFLSEVIAKVVEKVMPELEKWGRKVQATIDQIPEPLRESLVNAMEASVEQQRKESRPSADRVESDQAEAIEELYTPENIERMRERRNKIHEIIDQQTQEMREVRNQIDILDGRLHDVERRLNEAMLQVPNMPHESVPVGRDESENVVVRTWGQPKEFDFEPLPHWDLGPTLDIIDFERGVKLSGTRFYVLKGMGARLQRALITWMLDLHINEHGYTEIYPPFMVREECMWGAGQLPKFLDNIYHDVEDDAWFIGTAEIPLTNLHRDEILAPGALPLCYVAYTACFRREKMSAGRDTRGIKRGHQFDKVEMYKFTTPETSYDELERLLEDAEDVCRRLGIAHRVVQMCTGDLGFSAAKKYDVEMWAPGVQEWLEVSSCSNCEDFQTRRANIRYRPEPGARPRFVHTLNGSGLALPRVMIAIMENYQQADGSIVVPEVLKPYMGGVEVIR